MHKKAYPPPYTPSHKKKKMLADTYERNHETA